MDKQQAYTILEQATGMLSANREVHIQIQTALNVIKEAIAVKIKEPEEVGTNGEN